MKLKPHRILLVVSSMRKALRFYSQVLGFQIISDARRKGTCYDEITGIRGVIVRVVFLGVEACSLQIELVEYLKPKSARKATLRTNEVGAVRLCFTVDNLALAHEKLREKRVRSLHGPILLEKDGHRVARLLLAKDPDGYQLELREPKTSEESDNQTQIPS